MTESMWPSVRPVEKGASGFLISAQTTVLQVEENASVGIPCKAYGSAQHPVKRTEWKFKRGDKMVLVYHEGQLTERYKDRADFYPNELSLKSVTRKDTGEYTCEILDSSANGLVSSTVNLTVKVPPSKPQANVPSSAIIGNKAVLTCLETDGSPPPTYAWYKNNIPMPPDPKANSLFKNSSYTLDPQTGVLTFLPVTPYDGGDYFCEASNNVGTPQRSDVMHLEPTEINVGGIVAAVVVLLIVLGLVAFGIWFAYRRGYFSTKVSRGVSAVVAVATLSSRPSRSNLALLRTCLRVVMFSQAAGLGRDGGLWRNLLPNFWPLGRR
ncbi:hypothetical protein lerEdw1_021148 [Lerista edwardsae]|nr:hypothetical protein lerEdw1_021149 [Lerista edwardsae]KAJ6651255.1 hypothetical protein lerEdw1_021148 [Lerista edwardsae]